LDAGGPQCYFIMSVVTIAVRIRTLSVLYISLGEI